MLRKEETNELVKRVTAASLKAIAAEPELNVKFAPGQSSATAEEAVLPTPVGTLDEAARRGSEQAVDARVDQQVCHV